MNTVCMVPISLISCVIVKFLKKKNQFRQKPIKAKACNGNRFWPYMWLIFLASATFTGDKNSNRHYGYCFVPYPHVVSNHSMLPLNAN